MRKECFNYEKTWVQRCYKNGLPDDAPREIFDLAPSYKKIAIAILKNDVQVLGVIKKPCAAYISLKRIEIKGRENSNAAKQLTLFED